ncbi:MAG: adenylate kinase [Chloroflexi bacterium]|nr:adenylate kinase [Chloroflexota bacterium]
MRVILLGPPGAGKGTQVERLAKHLKVSRVSSGDLFREHTQKNTELGVLAKSYMGRGALVPDDVTIKMVMNWVNAPEQAKGFVLDGFPRTLGQATALDQALAEKGGIDKVLYIMVPREDLVVRLSGRMICRSCQTPYNIRDSQPKKEGKCDKCGGQLYQREDDKPEAVRKRLEVYTNETEPLADYYRSRGLLEEVDGNRSIEDVGQALARLVAA